MPESSRDYLLESRCERGHESAVAFRNVPLAFVREFADAWKQCANEDDDGSVCEIEIAHTITSLGAVEERRAADTQPSMPAVTPPERAIVVEDALPGPRSSRRPEPMPDDEGNVIAGD